MTEPAPDSETDWPYWSIDIPGLRRAEAEELVSIAKRTGMGTGGTTVDPNAFLTLNIDEYTVNALISVYDAFLPTLDSIAESDRLIVTSIIEIMREWSTGINAG